MHTPISLHDLEALTCTKSLNNCNMNKATIDKKRGEGGTTDMIFNTR